MQRVAGISNQTLLRRRCHICSQRERTAPASSGTGVSRQVLAGRNSLMTTV